MGYSNQGRSTVLVWLRKQGRQGQGNAASCGAMPRVQKHTCTSEATRAFKPFAFWKLCYEIRIKPRALGGRCSTRSGKGKSAVKSTSEKSSTMAEAVRFELTDGCPSPVFKTGAIDHSATPPCRRDEVQILPAQTRRPSPPPERLTAPGRVRQLLAPYRARMVCTASLRSSLDSILPL